MTSHENKEYIDHISGCNYVIKSYLIIVCHPLSRRRDEHGHDVIRPLKNGDQIGVHNGYIDSQVSNFYALHD